MEANLRHKQLYYLLEEADQRAAADEEDRCRLLSPLHCLHHRNFPPSLQVRH